MKKERIIRHWLTDIPPVSFRITYPITEVVRGYLQCLKINSLEGNILLSTFPMPEPPFLISGPNPDTDENRD